jgi:hypothetical protein
MIYFTTAGGGGACVIVEPGELERMLRGQPLQTPDGNILICYTPDMKWTESEWKQMLALTGGEIDQKIFERIMRMGFNREKVYR